jgi:hypothetical protein
MDSSAKNVLLKGGKEKLTGQRPATSHKLKKSPKEISCQMNGETGVTE